MRKRYHPNLWPFLLLLFSTALVALQEGSGGGKSPNPAKTPPPKAPEKESHEIYQSTQKCTNDGAAQVVWSTLPVAGESRKCDVTVRYSGTQNCEAWFDKPSGERKKANAREASDTISGVKELKFHCQGSEGGQCTYKIDKIKCGDTTFDPPEPTSHGAQPKCMELGSRTELFDKRPSCNVTVRLKGTEACEAKVLKESEGDDKPPLASAKEKDTVITIQNAEHLDLQCKGPGRGRCDFKIIQEECKKP